MEGFIVDLHVTPQIPFKNKSISVMCNLRWLEVTVQDKKTTTTTKIYTLYCHAVWMNLEVFDNLLYVFSYTSSMPMVKLHPDHCPSNPTAQVCEYNLPVDKNIIGDWFYVANIDNISWKVQAYELLMYQKLNKWETSDAKTTSALKYRTN